jgi:hypothetical protein
MALSNPGSDTQRPAPFTNASTEPPTDLPTTAEILPTLSDTAAEPKTNPHRAEHAHANANGALPDSDKRSDLELSLDLTSHTASDYWDASTMAPLNAVSAVSIA